MSEPASKVPVKTSETAPERPVVRSAWDPMWDAIDKMRHDINRLVEGVGGGVRRLPSLPAWHPVENLRREFDQLVEDYERGLRRMPFRRSVFEIEPIWRCELSWAAAPAVDIVEKDNFFEVVAELPGMDEKAVEVKYSDNTLTIKGEKQEEKEEKKKDYYLHERHFGSFERCFRVPEGVDADKIEAMFKGGVLTVKLPKKPEVKKSEKKIEIKAA